MCASIRIDKILQQPSKRWQSDPAKTCIDIYTLHTCTKKLNWWFFFSGDLISARVNHCSLYLRRCSIRILTAVFEVLCQIAWFDNSDNYPRIERSIKIPNNMSIDVGLPWTKYKISLSRKQKHNNIYLRTYYTIL